MPNKENPIALDLMDEESILLNLFDQSICLANCHQDEFLYHDDSKGSPHC